jgi:hypothetical protein
MVAHSLTPRPSLSPSPLKAFRITAGAAKYTIFCADVERGLGSNDGTGARARRALASIFSGLWRGRTAFENDPAYSLLDSALAGRAHMASFSGFEGNPCDGTHCGPHD